MKKIALGHMCDMSPNLYHSKDRTQQCYQNHSVITDVGYPNSKDQDMKNIHFLSLFIPITGLFDQVNK